MNQLVKKLVVALAVFVACTCIALAWAAQDKVLLRWKFAQGDSLRYRFQMTSTTTAGDVATVTEATIVYRWKVREVDADGIADVALSYSTIRVSVDAPTPVSYDSTRAGESAAKNDDVLSRMVAPLLEMKATVRVDPSGRVQEIRGVREALAKGLEAFEGAPERPSVRGLSALFDENAVRRLVETNIYPGVSLSIGGTWPREYVEDLGVAGTLHAELGSTLADIRTKDERTLALVDVDGSMRILPVEDETTRAVEVETIESSVEGTQTFDVTAGRLTDSSIDVELELRIKVGNASPFDSTTSSHQTLRLLAAGEPDVEPDAEPKAKPER